MRNLNAVIFEDVLTCMDGDIQILVRAFSEPGLMTDSYCGCACDCPESFNNLIIDTIGMANGLFIIDLC